MLRPRASHLVAALGALLLSSSTHASAPAPRDARSAKAPVEVCAKADPSLKVLTLGSSTMYSPLGRMLAKGLAAGGVKDVAKHAKSASGLARPDYYDWPEQAAAVLAEQQPDLVIVSMGGNDGQALKHSDGSWTPLDPPDWERELGRRVDGFLKLLAGRKRHRRVIWIGPQAADTDSGARRRKRVNDVLRERIAAFDGAAWFVDVVGRTAGDDGTGRQEFTPPRAAAPVPMRSRSKAHLSRAGVEWAMLEPTLALLTPCLPRPAKRHTAKAPGPSPSVAAPQGAGAAAARPASGQGAAAPAAPPQP